MNIWNMISNLARGIRYVFAVVASGRENVAVDHEVSTWRRGWRRTTVTAAAAAAAATGAAAGAEEAAAAAAKTSKT